MKITIDNQPNTPITEPISLELGKFTIFAGENNSGKTHLVRAIMQHKDLSGYQQIYIPAEENQPQDKQTKNSAKGDPFYKLVERLVKPFFDSIIFQPLAEQFNESKEKKVFLEAVNGILRDLGVNDKKFDMRLSEGDIKMEVVIKLVKAIVHDLYKTNIDAVDLENIGMGARRMIVAALIQTYSNLKEDTENVVVAFEEPEAYLHPKWKKSLYASLVKLSQKNNVFVLATTHDPYFIELGSGQKIYQVSRDSKKSDATAIKEMKNTGFLGFPSYAETNYQIFEISSEAYFLELYDYTKEKEDCKDDSYKMFDDRVFKKYFKEKGMSQDCKSDKGKESIMPITRLRHDIAHGKEKTDKITLEEATKELINFLNDLHPRG